jgi:hypothetical protein
MFEADGLVNRCFANRQNNFRAALFGRRNRRLTLGNLGRQQEDEREAEREHDGRAPQAGRQPARFRQHTGQHDAEQPAAGIGRIIKPDILRGAA